MGTYWIRQAEAGDAERMAVLLQETWRVAYKGLFAQRFLNQLQPAYFQEDLRRQLAGRSQLVLLLEDERGLLGLLALGWDRERVGWLEVSKCYVLPGLQKQGLGSALMAYCLAHVSQLVQGLKGSKLNGCPQGLRLAVVVGNGDALAFYQKWGFVVLEEQMTSQLAGASYACWLLERPLGVKGPGPADALIGS